jgi:hypothetical protein
LPHDFNQPNAIGKLKYNTPINCNSSTDQCIKIIAADIAETREKMSNFDTRFEAIEKQQEDNALTQTVCLENWNTSFVC